MITALLTIAIVGFLAWLVITYIPMPDPFKKVLIVVLVIMLILWLISGPGSLPRIG